MSNYILTQLCDGELLVQEEEDTTKATKEYMRLVRAGILKANVSPVFVPEQRVSIENAVKHIRAVSFVHNLFGADSPLFDCPCKGEAA